MQKTLSIIGCGNVGKTLARLWSENHVVTITQILNRSLSSSNQAVSFIGSGQAISSYEELIPSDIYMLGLPDDQLQTCSQRLAETGLLSSNSIVFHCSGSLPSSILSDVAAKGAFVASIHPIRSFASPEQVIASFPGTWCGMEGSQPALDTLRNIFTPIGAQLVEIRPDSKMIYHAAAVFASNYLVALLDIALEAYAEAGIPKNIALELISPLVKKTVDNVLVLGPEKSLSGPIARGDMITVEKQYQAVLSWNEKRGRLYSELAGCTAELARRSQDSLSTEIVAKPVDKA